MLLVWITGIFFSRFLQSVATISICLFSIPLLNKLPKIYPKTYFGISFLLIALIFFIPVFYSTNQAAFWNIYKNKIPFLFIPLSILYVGIIEKKLYDILVYYFILLCVSTAVWSYNQYSQNTDLYTQLYTKGQVIPTLIHHIPFSVLLSIGVVFCLNNILYKKRNFEKIINGIILLGLIYFIHILSVRTGIVLTYFGILLFVLIILIQFKKPLFAGGLAILILLIAILSYKTIPTVQNKISYTLYGIEQYKTQQDSSNQVSDSRRFLSDDIGVELIEQHPFLGVGFGDLQDAMNLIYKKRYPQFSQDVYSHIHNQYLYVFAGAGIVLGIIFIIGLGLPLLHFWKDKKWIFVIIYSQLLLVMLWEAFLQNQIGTSIYLFVICLGMISIKEVE